MKKINSYMVRQLFGCLIFFVFGCKQSTRYKQKSTIKSDSIKSVLKLARAYDSISSVEKKIQSGFLITRTGSDFTSEGLRSLNRRNKTYSHCGIASIEHDSLFVYHALGGEWNPDQKLKRDPFRLFADPANNRGIGIYSFQFTNTTCNKLINMVQQLYLKGVMFDMDFDLSTDDRMYCAEFVYKCLVKASDNKLVFNHSFIKQFEFIGVDDIFLHPGCKPMLKIVYK